MITGPSAAAFVVALAKVLLQSARGKAMGPLLVSGSAVLKAAPSGGNEYI
jgi:hypothetical protein